MEEWLEQLNPDQLRAVTHEGGPLLVTAGPGTGKTRVLTLRIGHLLSSGRAKSREILAITFTNHAAAEISERVKGLLSEEGGALPHVGTFHGWALGFLGERRGKQARLPIDDEQSMELCREAALDAGLGASKFRRLYPRLSRAKQHWPPRLDDDKELSALYDSYQALLERHGLWDYDDILLEALRELQDAGVRESFRTGVPFLLVDEFQDVSPVQYALVKAMAAGNGNVTVIGDPNQAIYGFRGASPRFLERFREDFEAVAVIHLTKAYRCPGCFLDAAAAVVRAEPDRRLVSERGTGPAIHVKACGDPRSEAAWIAGTIEKTVGGLSFDSLNRGLAGGHEIRSLSEVAVLYRANVLAGPLREALSRANIPYQTARSSNPLAEKNLRSVWRLWEAALGRCAEFHLGRLSCDRPVTPDILQGLKASLLHEGTTGLLSGILDFLGLDGTVHPLRGLRHAVKNHPDEFSLPLLLRQETDLIDIHLEAVTLISMHGAKGLEFPVVFLAGCEEKILPWMGSDHEEERRLFYVALTRASERVYMSYAGKRRLFGETLPGRPSPFLSEIPENLWVKQERRRPKKPRRPKQKTLF